MKLDASRPPSPRQNQLLAALPPEDYERLLPDLEPVPLPVDWDFPVADAHEHALYFPTSGIVARYRTTTDGVAASAVTGSEGMIGVAFLLGGASTPSSRVVVLCEGQGFRVDAERLKRWFDRDGPLPRVVLRYVQALIAETGQIAVCNRHHPLDQRLCRWILACLDRLPSDRLTMTHERIAAMLGVRREGVTEALGRLQRAGLIHVGRGHVDVPERQRMEARACECYGVIAREYDRLLPADRAMAPGRAPGERGSVGNAMCASAHAP